MTRILKYWCVCGHDRWYKTFDPQGLKCKRCGHVVTVDEFLKDMGQLTRGEGAYSNE